MKKYKVVKRVNDGPKFKINETVYCVLSSDKIEEGKIIGITKITDSYRYTLDIYDHYVIDEDSLARTLKEADAIAINNLYYSITRHLEMEANSCDQGRMLRDFYKKIKVSVELLDDSEEKLIFGWDCRAEVLHKKYIETIKNKKCNYDNYCDLGNQVE